MRFKTLRLATAAIACVLAAAGCAAAAPTPSPVPTPSPSPAGVLLTVETRGGECVQGPCGMTIFVEHDGLVHVAAKPPNELGVVTPDALAALEEAIRTTDFAELRSHPFTGECPTSFDGQEFVFEFAAPTGVERIASCEVEVDMSAPLFVAVSDAVGSFVSLPIP